jgi:predicted DNA-binding transcriptional regulator AlpA
MSDKKLLKIKEVLQMVPVSKTTWYKGVKSGRYPQSVKIGEKATAWRREDIEKYIDELQKTKNNA